MSILAHVKGKTPALGQVLPVISLHIQRLNLNTEALKLTTRRKHIHNALQSHAIQDMKSKAEYQIRHAVNLEFRVTLCPSNLQQYKYVTSQNSYTHYIINIQTQIMIILEVKIYKAIYFYKTMFAYK